MVSRVSLRLQDVLVQGGAWHDASHSMYQKKKYESAWRGCVCSPRCVIRVCKGVGGVLRRVDAISPPCHTIMRWNGELPGVRTARVLANRVDRTELRGNPNSVPGIRASNVEAQGGRWSRVV